VLRSHEVDRGAHTDHAREDVGRNAHAGQARRTGDAVRDVPLHEIRLRELIREHAESGNDGGYAEARGFIAEKRHLEQIPGLGAVDLDRPGQGVPPAE
jgi:hypothetical protein